jgi:uncharacterized protein (TIGR02147 family)
MSIFEHSNYRTFLRANLVARIQRNSNYSLRAFAQQLGITSSYLSEILNEKKNLSSESALKISSRLGLKGDESEYFRLLVQLGSTRDPELKAVILARAKAINPNPVRHDLSVDYFKMIADWFHLPIRQLASIEGFDFNSKNIASRLGISRHEAEEAIERLVRLELIEKDASGRYRKTDNNMLVKSPVPNNGLRKFHRQMLNKAIEALETQTPAEKFIGSETLAFDPAQLKQAETILEECFSRLVELTEAGKSKSQVYHLGIQFFNLTQERK